MASLSRKKGDPERVSTACTSPGLSFWASSPVRYGGRVTLIWDGPDRVPEKTEVSRTCPELISQLQFHGVGVPLEFRPETGRGRPGLGGLAADVELQAVLGLERLRRLLGLQGQAALGRGLELHRPGGAGIVEGGHLELEAYPPG